MNRCKANNDTQSDNDETINEMINASDHDGLMTQEISQDPIFPMGTAFPTSGLNSSSANYPIQYPDSTNRTIFPPTNGLNINPIYYTDTQTSAFVADDRNVANYEEVSTHSYSYTPPTPTPISLYSEINRPALPVYNDFQYPPTLITPLPTYSVNDQIPYPFATPKLPSLSSDTVNNNLSEPTESSQQTTAVIQTASQSKNELIQKTKKRGRKRLSDNANRIKKANIFSEGNETFPSDNSGHSVPKKRGRKRKGGADDIRGKTNKALQEIARQSINDSNLEINKANVDNSQTQNVEISNHNSAEVKNVEEIKEEKTKKKRSRKKIETKSDDTINDMVNYEKNRSLTAGKPSVAKKNCMEEELLSKQKNRVSMAFPVLRFNNYDIQKGTFLIRYSDLETLDCDQIWCVDNHHMLLKYRLSTHIEGKRRLYLKSQPERFIGWKCEEPWHFYQLEVIERDRDNSKVLILYPDAKELAECREKARRQKQIAEEMKGGVNAGDIKQEQIVSDETNENLTNTAHQQEDVEVQMALEAANAIERFILIPDDDYTEINEEHPAETVLVQNPVEEHVIISEIDNE
ncbi:unnamed protein product [Onchocerca ochengi]|uniref:SET domain-containing protein n=1 Tax=Onchocerca ochengi TaxID=42157 RepID=A0A182E7D5_ONCOC|nr:unnamed protein product [Onchocerca ochengi]